MSSLLKIPVGPGDHAQGHADAKVTLVEYGDYECPYCAAAHPVVAQVREIMGSKLRYVFRHFPLTQVHPHALPAAKAAEFAATGGKFWNFHDALYRQQSRLGPRLYDELAKAEGLDLEQLHAVLASDEYVKHIEADFNGGVRSGVNGTPSFFINGRRYDGPADLDDLAAAVRKAITHA